MGSQDMTGASTLLGLLDQLDQVVNGDQYTSVVGLGILLLRRRFSRLSKFDEVQDPTEAILGRKIGGIGSREMIPEL